MANPSSVVASTYPYGHSLLCTTHFTLATLISFLKFSTVLAHRRKMHFVVLVHLELKTTSDPSLLNLVFHSIHSTHTPTLRRSTSLDRCFALTPHRGSAARMHSSTPTFKSGTIPTTSLSVKRYNPSHACQRGVTDPMWTEIRLQLRRGGYDRRHEETHR